MSTQSGTPRVDWSLPVFGLFPLVLVVAFLTMNLRREVRANYLYVEGRCVLIDKRVFEDPFGGGGTYRPEFLIRYPANGGEHEVWAYDAHPGYASAWRWPKALTLERFTVGHEY